VTDPHPHPHPAILPAGEKIAGVIVQPLLQIPDDRGKVMHMLKRTDPHFREFGEIYFSTVYPGVVKGWHLHRVMTINYAAVAGTIKVVLFDDREGSPTRRKLQEVYLGDGSYCLLVVPPGIWNGFKACGTEMAIVANCATIPHDPAEIERLDPTGPAIPYDWGLKHR
jgi:dTDP-4-dehydrorhamnose 3,5-epimerase